MSDSSPSVWPSASCPLLQAHDLLQMLVRHSNRSASMCGSRFLFPTAPRNRWSPGQQGRVFPIIPAVPAQPALACEHWPLAMPLCCCSRTQMHNR